MKTGIPLFRYMALCSVMLLSAAVNVGGTSIVHPARFGVINIIPNERSAESAQDCEPSLAAGLNANYGKVAVHAFSLSTQSLISRIYASANSGDTPWMAPWSPYDWDATMDWSAGGICYLVLIPGLRDGGAKVW
jgi:hypothetical protein